MTTDRINLQQQNPRIAFSKDLQKMNEAQVYQRIAENCRQVCETIRL
jgi:hypothetical protein